jgi:hypothetical protein
MNKAFIFSDLYLCTFPFVEFPLYYELKNKNIDVKYVLQKNDIRTSITNVWSKYEKLDLIIVDKVKDVIKISSEGDLFIIRFCYKGAGGKAAQVLRKHNREVLQYDVGGVDIAFRDCPAKYLSAKSKHLKDRAIKKFPNSYKNVFVTGTIHYDSAYTTRVDRAEFLKSYGLDHNMKFVILTPASPGEAWMPGLKETYKKIVDVIGKRCPDYQIAVKCHPLDYMADMNDLPGVIKKGQHYNNKQSWKELFPDITVIRAEEGYKAIRACDAILNVRSSIAMETALFRKPLININREKYVANWPFDQNVMLDIKMKELASVLNAGNYSVDEDACVNYVTRENCADDGKAYVRTAEAAIKILGGRA